MNALESLLAVQEHDTALDRLRHRRATLPQRAQLSQVEAELSALTARLASLDGERGELERRRAGLESEVDDLERRATDLDRRLHSGEVTATRELTAMVEQVDALKRRRSLLEDEELELMVALEPLDAEATTLSGRQAELDGQAAGLRAELAVELDARAAAAVDAPDKLLGHYEHLRNRLGGVGAARLVGSSCGGCHLTLSATELERIRHEPPDVLITCEQCGRILVR